MDWSWITTTWASVGMTAVTAAGMYVAVILYTRIGGLRSFSKMSSFDFAITVAIGSLIASSVLTEDPPLLRSAAVLGVIYVLQLGLARLRERWEPVRRLLDNRPVLLVVDGELIQEAMRAVRVTRGDIMAKLREANVLRLEDARAVVMETTGDISVLHASGDRSDRVLDPELLEGVERIGPQP
jgi:uncharacterized membrane protein YcaP (DUF421 family)